MSTMICTYCRRELDDATPDTSTLLRGGKTVDGTTDLRWIARDVFAGRPCVEEHFVAARAPARGVAERLAELLREGDDDRLGR